MGFLVPGSAGWRIEQERPEHRDAVEALVARVFGPGRFAKAAYRLREGVHPVSDLGFVATENGLLRGSVRFWPISAGSTPALLLGPLAVESDQRGRGIGIALMQYGIGAAREGGYRAVLLVGDSSYYARVGFTPLPKNSVAFPGPVAQDRILGLPLVDGALGACHGSVARAWIDEPVCPSGASVRMQ